MSQPLEAKCEKLMKRNNQLVTTMRESDRKTKKMKEETESMVRSSLSAFLSAVVVLS